MTDQPITATCTNCGAALTVKVETKPSGVKWLSIQQPCPSCGVVWFSIQGFDYTSADTARFDVSRYTQVGDHAWEITTPGYGDNDDG